MDARAYEEQRSAIRAQKRRDEAASNRPEAPSGPSEPVGRTFGFQSGAAKAPAAAIHGAEAQVAGSELGDPSSYRGGAGAPAPVEVVRGLRTTYTNPARDTGDGGYNPTPGRGTQEFATPIQARQAYNRGQALAAVAPAPRMNLTYPAGTTPQEQVDARYGTYRAPGQTLAEIRATAEPPAAAQERRMKGEVFEEAKKQKQLELQQATEKQNVADFNREILGSPYAKFVPGQGHVWKPETEDLSLDAKAAENVARKGGWEAGLRHMDERQLARKWLQTQSLPAGFNAHAYLNMVSQNPAAWKELVDKSKAANVTPGPIRQPGYFEAGRNIGNADPFAQ